MCFPVQNSIDTQDKVTLSQLATPRFYRPILISVGMRFLQQMTGITPILVYLEPIFSHSNFALQPRWGLYSHPISANSFYLNRPQHINIVVMSYCANNAALLCLFVQVRCCSRGCGPSNFSCHSSHFNGQGRTEGLALHLKHADVPVHPDSDNCLPQRTLSSRSDTT